MLQMSSSRKIYCNTNYNKTVITSPIWVNTNTLLALYNTVYKKVLNCIMLYNSTYAKLHSKANKSQKTSVESVPAPEQYHVVFWKLSDPIKSDLDPICQIRSDWIILIRGSNSDLIRSDSDSKKIIWSDLIWSDQIRFGSDPDCHR